MKQVILLILFLGAFQSILAQDWQPFELGNTYNYYNQSINSALPLIYATENCTGQYPSAPNYPTNLYLNSIVDLQIWIDSTASNNLDSVYYFNKKIIACDTCSEPAIIVNQPLDYGLFNDYYIKNNLGQYIFMYQGDSLIIDPSMSINDSIVSDYTSDLSVKVGQADWGLVLILTNAVVQDSLKLIQYYDVYNTLVYEVQISKNYGIQKFKDIAQNTSETNLLGIEKDEIGLLQLTWKRAFDFNPGDVLCYIDIYRHTMNYDDNTSKVKFLTRQDIGNDTIIYTAIINRKRNLYGFPSGTQTTIDTVNLVLTEDEIRTDTYYPEFYENGFGNISCLKLRDNELKSDYSQGLSLWGEGFASKDFLFDGSMGQYKCFSYSYGLENRFPMTWRINTPNFEIDTASNVYYYNYNYNYVNIQEFYRTGLGLVYRYQPLFEGFSCHSLIGSIKGTDTLGIILPDQFFLEVKDLFIENNKNLEIELYPNPVDKHFTITLNGLEATENVQFVLSDVYGKVIQIYSKEVQSSYDLEVGDLDTGIYLLQLKNDAGILLGFKKIIVN
jgi:hypothetical protein